MTTSGGRRDLSLLAAGQAVSVAGDSAALVALLLRLRPAGSGWVAALLAAELVPFVVLAGTSGRIVDRVETRRVLLVALVGQAAVAVPLALLTAPWATVALFVVLNGLATLVRPATSALVPAAVGAAGAPRGFARLATGASLGLIAGPALGGLVSGAAGSTAALLADAGSFACLAGATALVRARRPPTSAAPGQPATAGGFALIWSVPVLRLAVLVTAIAGGSAVVDNVAAPYRFIDQLGASDVEYSLYLTLWGAGAFVGVQLLRRVHARHHLSLLAAGALLIGVGIAGIGLAPTLSVALVASLAGGLGNGVVNVTQNALVAANTGAHQHGRAFAAAAATTQAALGVGTAAAAPIVATLGAGTAMALAGAVTAVTAVVGLALSRPVGRHRGARDRTGGVPHEPVRPSDQVERPDCRLESSTQRAAR